MRKTMVLLIGTAAVQLSMAASNLDQAATDACTCMEEPYARMAEARDMVMQAMASGDYNKMTTLEGEFADMQIRVEECFDGLRKKYPDIDQSQKLKDEVTAKMKQKCPPPQLGFGPPPQ